MKISSKLQKGFTLIELLVVIAVLAVLATGVLVLIDPLDKVNNANDSKVQQDVGALGRSSEAYAATHNGLYPYSTTELTASGELKVVPAAPVGYMTYSYVVPTACTSTNDPDCTSVTIVGQLKAKRYINATTPVTYQRYETTTNKVCQVATLSAPCPP